MTKRLDLLNQTFGQLEVIEFEGVIKRKSVFKCRCSCGRMMSINGTALRGKRGTTKCRKCSNKKYSGDVSGTYLCAIKRRAIRDNISCEITSDDIWELFLKQNKKCILSGIDLIWKNVDNKIGNASVDRKDNNIGYTKENIQIVHKDINMMKSDYQESFFLELCKKVASFDGKFTPFINYKLSKRHPNWVGVGGISTRFFNRMKSTAAHRKINFNLEIEYCWGLYLQQGGICALSGIPISFSENSLSKLTTCSLDRIDSSKEYSEDNIQWVHKDINRIKWRLDQSYFIETCKLITKNGEK